MRDAADWGLAHAPKARIEAEQHNVEIPAYIVAVKPGGDDRDLHVIVSDQPSGPRAPAFRHARRFDPGSRLS